MVRRRPERTVLTPCRIGPVDQPRRVAKGPVAGGEDQPVPLEHGGGRSSRLGAGVLLDHDELTLGIEFEVVRVGQMRVGCRTPSWVRSRTLRSTPPA
jgi:hypothetical protein